MINIKDQFGKNGQLLHFVVNLRTEREDLRHHAWYQ